MKLDFRNWFKPTEPEPPPPPPQERLFTAVEVEAIVQRRLAKAKRAWEKSK